MIRGDQEAAGNFPFPRRESSGISRDHRITGIPLALRKGKIPWRAQRLMNRCMIINMIPHLFLHAIIKPKGTNFFFNNFLKNYLFLLSSKRPAKKRVYIRQFLCFTKFSFAQMIKIGMFIEINIPIEPCPHSAGIESNDIFVYMEDLSQIYRFANRFTNYLGIF